jgi:hypothetical protein
MGKAVMAVAETEQGAMGKVMGMGRGDMVLAPTASLGVGLMAQWAVGLVAAVVPAAAVM